MSNQLSYIVNTYAKLKRRYPVKTSKGYILNRSNARYPLRSYCFDKDMKYLKIAKTRKRRYSMLNDPESIIRKSNKRRKVQIASSAHVAHGTTNIDNQAMDIDSDNENVPKTRNRNDSDNSLDLSTEIIDKIEVVEKCYEKNNLWSNFNNPLSYQDYIFVNKDDEWVSATRIANFLLNDPVLDWYRLFYNKLGFNNGSKHDFNSVVSRLNSKKGNNESLNILFEMGNKFEDTVVAYLKKTYGDNVKTVHSTKGRVRSDEMMVTKQYMEQGVPIIDQAPIYNFSNKTFGVADLLVRSDWINKIIDSKPYSKDEEYFKAPKLSGNYHYVVIDIKWTTLPLCCDGERIRNYGRFPAYKGQLAIYNAGLEYLQGYIPSKAFILAKSWKYTSKREEYEGYNCFDLLGHIVYNGFDEEYIQKTINAVNWIRNLRAHGSKWTLAPRPSIPELYPNMCNTYDSGWRMIKINQADEIKELTSLWMVGHKNRKVGHNNQIYGYNNPNCKADKLGIYGKKVGPLLNQIIKMEHSKNPDLKIMPKVISNDLGGWQTKTDIEFFVDFEMLNTQFVTKQINLENSKTVTDFLFMIGVGYEENNNFIYKCFYADDLSEQSEYSVVNNFKNFIEFRVAEHMKKYNIKDRGLCIPKLFHWSPAEKSTLKHFNSRHNNKVLDWEKNIMWVDFCKVFKEEPIILKGAKSGFGLKTISGQMYKNGWIKTHWETTGPENGLDAMFDGCKYYSNPDENKELFAEVIRYNCIDCKVLWEIVNYFRDNHANETFKRKRNAGELIDHTGEADDDDMMFPEAIED